MNLGFKGYLDTYPDFPKPGILYYDISRLLRDNWLLAHSALLDKLNFLTLPPSGILFAGIESRGFLLSSMLASDSSDYGMIMVRKKGKLPGETIEQPIKLEYGEAVLECYPGSGNVVLCDDVIATGGTMLGAEKLLKKAGYNVIARCSILNLKYLNNIDNIISLVDINENEMPTM